MKVLILLCGISCIFALPWHSNNLADKLEEADITEEVIRSHYKKIVFNPDDNGGNLQLLGFSWSNCAKGSDLTINKLSISPDPIVIPGNVTVGLDATIATEVTEITSAILVVKKKIFGTYIEVPCVNNLGSCTYNDFCNILSNITDCPEIITAMGFTCKCPFKAKDYEVPDGTSINIPKLPIPSSLEDGDYDIKVTLMNGSTTLACYEFKASLKAAGYSGVYAHVVKK